MDSYGWRAVFVFLLVYWCAVFPRCVLRDLSSVSSGIKTGPMGSNQNRFGRSFVLSLSRRVFLLSDLHSSIGVSGSTLTLLASTPTSCFPVPRDLRQPLVETTVWGSSSFLESLPVWLRSKGVSRRVRSRSRDLSHEILADSRYDGGTRKLLSEGVNSTWNRSFAVGCKMISLMTWLPGSTDESFVIPGHGNPHSFHRGLPQSTCSPEGYSEAESWADRRGWSVSAYVLRLPSRWVSCYLTLMFLVREESFGVPERVRQW